jgi:hypothetical protein
MRDMLRAVPMFAANYGHRAVGVTRPRDVSSLVASLVETHEANKDYSSVARSERIAQPRHWRPPDPLDSSCPSAPTPRGGASDYVVITGRCVDQVMARRGSKCVGMVMCFDGRLVEHLRVMHPVQAPVRYIR